MYKHDDDGSDNAYHGIVVMIMVILVTTLIMTRMMIMRRMVITIMDRLIYDDDAKGDKDDHSRR